MAQARDYANMTKSTKPETNRTASTSPPLHGRPLTAQRGRPRLQQLSTKQTTTATVICPRFCNSFCPRQQTKKTRRRNRTENERGSSKHTSTAKSLQTLPQNLPPIPPSARSRSTSTTVQSRDSTVSPLLNKRLRCVVDEANGLMHRVLARALTAHKNTMQRKASA